MIFYLTRNALKNKDVTKMARNEHNTPFIIKYPFWRITAQNENAVYACINCGEAYAPDEIGKQSICIDADIDKVITELQSL